MTVAFVRMPLREAQHMHPWPGNPPRLAGFRRTIGGAALLAIACTLAAAAEAAAPRPLPAVAAGTPVDPPADGRWNRVILLAESRITRGDTDSVPQMIRERVPLFTLALLASVATTDQGSPRHRLAEIGAGYAVPLAGRLTVVSPEAPPPEAGLDMLARQVLSENGRHLAALACVGAGDTMQVVDAPAVICRDGQHLESVMRHFIWIDPGSGQCSACVWLLAGSAATGLTPTEDRPRWVPAGTREDREIHVDKSRFLWGLPTREAFALVDLPPGAEFDWSPALREVAAHPRYDAAPLRTLATELNAALAALRDHASPQTPAASAERQSVPEGVIPGVP
ncbi:MAG: hypothetical protein RLZZ440_550 [Planctomycetota bacterium]